MTSNPANKIAERQLAFSKFAIGDVYSVEFAVTPDVMKQFQTLSGDNNPIHLDDSYARERGFAKAIAFGGLTAVMLSRLVGMKLPVQEVVIVQSKFEFRSPVYVGQVVLLRAEVASLHSSVETIALKLEFSVAASTLCTGQCLIKCT